ncbi:hypothetical protein GOV11_04100, partial [Candidatus Woesearchaeota archaeon]|nr:hypothetical protein [Candidatus Woesearchaeota archaeon]
MALTREQKLQALQAAQPQGLSRQQKIQLLQQAEVPKPQGSALQAGVESFGQAATLGFLPKIQAAVEPAIRTALESVLGDTSQADLEAQGFKFPEEQGTTFEQREAANIARQAQLSEDFPKASLAGTVGGALAGGGIAGAGIRGAGRLAASGIAKAAPGIGEAGLALAEGSPVITRAAQLGGEGAIIGGVQDGEGGATIGGALGGAIPVVGAAARGVARAAPDALVSGLALAVGKRPETLRKYNANIERILKTEGISKGDVVEKVEVVVNKLKKSARDKKLDLVDTIQIALGDLKDKVVKEADVALDILEADSSLKFSLNSIKKPFEKQLARLSRTGVAGPQASQARTKIKSLLNDLETMPDVLDGPALKLFLKSVDESTEFLQIPGTFAKNKTQGLLIGIRGEIDDILKTASPEYKKQMGVTKRLVDIQEAALSRLGGQDKAFSAISRLGKPQSAIKDQALKALSKEQGIDLERFRKAQESADLFSGWNGLSIEGKISTLMHERSPELKKLFESLGKIGGEDFVTVVEDLAVRTELESQIM